MKQYKVFFSGGETAEGQIEDADAERLLAMNSTEAYQTKDSMVRFLDPGSVISVQISAAGDKPMIGYRAPKGR